MNSEPKVIEVVGEIIRRGDRFLLGKRSIGKAQGWLWEFIGGKIEVGESPCEALARECVKRLHLNMLLSAGIHQTKCNRLIFAQPTPSRYRSCSRIEA